MTTAMTAWKRRLLRKTWKKYERMGKVFRILKRHFYNGEKRTEMYIPFGVRCTYMTFSKNSTATKSFENFFSNFNLFLFVPLFLSETKSQLFLSSFLSFFFVRSPHNFKCTAHDLKRMMIVLSDVLFVFLCCANSNMRMKGFKQTYSKGSDHRQFVILFDCIIYAHHTRSVSLYDNPKSKQKKSHTTAEQQRKKKQKTLWMEIIIWWKIKGEALFLFVVESLAK